MTSLFLTAGTGVLRQLSIALNKGRLSLDWDAVRRRNTADLLRSAANGAAKAENLHAGLKCKRFDEREVVAKSGFGVLVKAYIDYLSEALAADPSEAWPAIVELQVIRALTDQTPTVPVPSSDSPRECVGVFGGSRADYLAAFALQGVMNVYEWQMTPIHVPMVNREMTADQARQAAEAITLEFASARHASPVPLLAVIAGGTKTMTSLFSIIALGTGIELAQVMNGERPDGSLGAWLVPVIRSESNASLAGHRDLGGLGAAVFGALEDWQRKPHEVHRVAFREEAMASEDARGRMAKRTAAWIVGDVWQADLLPQIAHHGVLHGRRVDETSNEILRRATFVQDLGEEERDAAVEALSAAAWLHDVGQRGGLLGLRYARDNEHVRSSHGLLTQIALSDKHGLDNDFGLDDEQLLWLVGQLCLRHQRTFALTDADSGAKKFKGCPAHREHPTNPAYPACDICDHVQARIDDGTLEQVWLDRATSVLNPAPVQLQTAVRLGAILRLADATDIGAHRVNGRWRTAARHGIENGWRRDFASDVLYEAIRVCQNEAREDAFRAVNRLILDPHWPRGDMLAAQKNLKAAEAPHLADALADYEDFISQQAVHVGKHRYFLGTRILDGLATGTIEFELMPSSEWIDLDTPRQQEWFEEAARYIWDEYCDSSMYFEEAPGEPKTGMVSLIAVKGPGGRRMDRSDEKVKERFENLAYRLKPRT